MKKAYAHSVEQVAAQLNTSLATGLTESEVAKRLAEFGPNELEQQKKTSLWKRLLVQLSDPMLLLLIAAALVSLVVGIVQGESNAGEVGIILFVVVINTVLGVAQEAKAEAALAALQAMSAPTSHVVRNDKLYEVPSKDVVPGDIIVLEAGMAVPADARVCESAQLKVEEAALTGESNPIEKTVDALAMQKDAEVALGDRTNMVYTGSTVVYGRGRAVVVHTGMQTQMGHIANSINEAEDGQTPLQRKLAELSKILTVSVVIICAVIFILSFLKHGAAFMQNISLVINTFMIAVSLAVAAIPEGLAAVVTIVLSLGVMRMSKRHAIVRKLTAVETLGCTQIICSDKTGTLTQNKMSVVKKEADDVSELMRGMALCSDAQWIAEDNMAKGEPTEAALVADAAGAGFDTERLDAEYPRVGEVPFDSARKMMSVIVKSPESEFLQYTKGAPDELIKRATHIYQDGQVVRLDDARRQALLARNKEMADDALRVMGLAKRTWQQMPNELSAAALETNLCIVGLAGMRDPVRPEVAPSIQEAKAAGIRVIMITGDHIDTAVAIGKQLELIANKQEAMTGAQIDALQDSELVQALDTVSVFARVQPEHKVRIVEALKSCDQIVAMTGDGVNDAPSIKRADIGIGMGITGTDVTKNVADMVLADDNFATIVDAVSEGRRIYDNIRKSIQFLLSSNIAEVIVVFIATLIGFTILEPAQLLWINLMTDTFPALALGLEPGEADSMRKKPRSAKDGIFANGMALDVLFQGVIISLLTLASYYVGHYIEFGTFDLSNVMASPHLGQEGITMAFLTLSMVEMFHSFNMRSRRRSLFTLRSHNWWLIASCVVSLILTTCVIEMPALASLFGFASLDMRNYLAALCLALSIIPIMECYKAIARLIHHKKHPGEDM